MGTVFVTLGQIVMNPAYSPSVFERAIINLLRQAPGCGSFREERISPNGSRIVHRFALATGMSESLNTGKYQGHFGELPSWVLPLHPYHRSGLCRLALHLNLPLPTSRPLVPAEHLGATTPLDGIADQRAAQPPRRQPKVNPLYERIRQTLIEAATIEVEKLAFNLFGRAHEPRITLDRQLAQILRNTRLPHVRISGFGPNLHYPRRVFSRAGEMLQQVSGRPVLLISQSDGTVRLIRHASASTNEARPGK
jgi:hypothetical protein